MSSLSEGATSCSLWSERAGHPPAPKSACIGCPFRSNEGWAQLKRADPEAWAEAVALDASLREGTWEGVIRGTPYLHRSGLPLDQAPIEYAGQLDLWPNECEGMCGL